MPSNPEAPIDLATRQQVYLERLKSGFVRNWRGAESDLRERIRAVLVAIEGDNLQDLTRKELQKVLIQLREAHLTVSATIMSEFLNDDLPALAEFAAGLEVAGLEYLTGRKFAAPTAKLAFQAARLNPIQATGQLLGDMIADWPKADALRVSNVVRSGWAQGKTVSQMVREVIGTKGEGYKNGILNASRRHASTVIHTATQHVANASRQDVWERNGDIVSGYIWVSTLDRRTTQQCKSLDGREFEAGKGPMPPIHPNCRSTTVAKLGPEWDFLDEGATRASSGPNAGYVDANESYYSWLKRQPSDFQEIALGPTRAKLFRNGGLTADRFAELNLGRNFEPLTLAEMRKIEPGAFSKAGL